MAREQLGICAEPNLHGLVLFFNALDGCDAKIRTIVALLPGVIHRLSEQFSEANLTSVIAIGAAYWDTLYPLQRPTGLAPYTAMSVSDLAMPAIPYDLLLQIRADRYDVLHLAAQQCYQQLSAFVELVEQNHAFRFLDGRDLTGFIDQPQAPRGRLKRQLALIGESDQAIFSGGSYLHFQRYRLDLNRWQMLTQAQQEAIIGWRKVDGNPLPLAQLSSNSHAKKAALIDHKGQQLPLVFQNMPFGQLKVQGMLMFGFSTQPRVYLDWLRQRLGDEQAQNYDLLLDYIQADAGAAFFVPSINFMEEQAGL